MDEQFTDNILPPEQPQSNDGTEFQSQQNENAVEQPKEMDSLPQENPEPQETSQPSDSVSQFSYTVPQNYVAPQKQQVYNFTNTPNNTVLAKPPVSGKAVASLVLGIIGLLFVFTVFFSPVSIILGIVGLVLGIISVKKARSGLGIAGIILSSISLGIGLIETVSCVACIGLMSKGVMELEGIEDFNFGPFHDYIEGIQEPHTI